MNPTQERQQFDTAFKGLTPEEQKKYTAANPNINVGGENYTYGRGLDTGGVLGATPITADLLSQNVRPYNLPNTPVSTTAPTVIQTAVSGNEAIKTQTADELARQQKIDELNTKNSIASTGLQGVLEKLGIRGQEKIQAEQTAGIPQKRRELDEINSLIEAKNLSITRQLEDIQQNKLGQTESGVAGSVREIQKQGARELADLSIIQNARNRNLLTAQTLVNQKIELETEDLKNRFDALKFFYDDNKESLSKEEQRQFEVAIKKADREYTDTKEKVKTLEDTKLEIYKNLALNNAPLSVYEAVNLASNKEDAKPEDIIAAAGSLGGDVKKQLEIKKLQKEINDINPQNSVDIKNLPIAGQNLLASVRNLRFTTVEESKRIIGNITRALAQGDVEGATEELRIFGYQKLKGAQQTDYDLYEGAKASADSALSQIADQNISTGPYKTLLENKKPWLSIQRDKEFVDLKSIIELGQAQLRKGFYGTAVTGTEAANARNFLIVDSDDINTIKWKLTNTSAFLQFVNDATIARNVGMEKPKLDDYLTYVVKDKQTGQLGVVPRSEYNPEAYEITKQ